MNSHYELDINDIPSVIVLEGTNDSRLLGLAIKEYRARHGLSVRDLAERLCVNYSTLSRIESGCNLDLKVGFLRRVSDYFNVIFTIGR